MAIEHRKLPIAAVQFHPESIMSLAGGVGLAIIRRVVEAYAKARPLSGSFQDKEISCEPVVATI
jgi:anthranilate synthase